MSLNVFSAELPLEPETQRVVFWSGVLMGFCGLLMILLLPISPAWRLLGGVACLVTVLSELQRARRSRMSYSHARFVSDGSAALLDREGQWQQAEILPGSLLLRHYGWLRLQSLHGERIAALFRGRCRQSADWRRLQVIWRHVGDAT